jgi:hypothetical protein
MSKFKFIGVSKLSLAACIALFLISTSLSGYSNNPNRNHEPSLQGKKVLYVYGG